MTQLKPPAVCPVLRSWDRWEIDNGDCALIVTLAGGLGGGLFTAVVGTEDTRTVRRFLVPLGRFRLPRREGAAAVSGRGWGVLLHRSDEATTLTLRVDDFLDHQGLNAHLTITGEGPMNVFQVSGQVSLGEQRWEFPLSHSSARLTRVRRGQTLD